MRGHCLPTSFLVLAGVAGLWLLAGSFGQRTVAGVATRRTWWTATGC